VMGGLFLISFICLKVIEEKKFKIFFGVLTWGCLVFLSAWWWFYRGFDSLPIYLGSSFEFVAGNDSAMSIDPGNNASGVYFLVVLAALLFLNFYLKEKKLYLINFIFWMPFMAIFKYAFGRQDAVHVREFLTFLLVYVFIVLIQEFSARKKIVFCAIICLPLLLFFRNYAAPDFLRYAAKNSGFKSGLRNLNNSVFNYKSYKDKLLALSKKILKKEALSLGMLDEIGSSSVDIYPWNATYVQANNLNWRPRPIFQSFLSYTPWLDKNNQVFLSGLLAPDYIVWVRFRQSYCESIDTRYLFNDEPMAMHKIIDNYEPVLYEQKAMLLKKKSRPTFGATRKLYSEQGKWGQWIKVPAYPGNHIEAKVKFVPTLPGRIKRLFWKEKEVFIEYELKDGEIAKHRIAPDNAVAGIWIHPYITDLTWGLKDGEDIYNLNADEGANLYFGKTVTQIRFSYKDQNTFEPLFTVTWQETSVNH